MGTVSSLKVTTVLGISEQSNPHVYKYLWGLYDDGFVGELEISLIVDSFFGVDVPCVASSKVQRLSQEKQTFEDVQKLIANSPRVIEFLDAITFLGVSIEINGLQSKKDHIRGVWAQVARMFL
jgi:hypothetical protein